MNRLDALPLDSPRKQVFHLFRRMQKLSQVWERKQAEAESNAIDLLGECNTICSKRCFEDIQASADVENVLLRCVVAECKCFKAEFENAEHYRTEEKLLTSRNTNLDTEMQSDSATTSALVMPCHVKCGTNSFVLLLN